MNKTLVVGIGLSLSVASLTQVQAQASGGVTTPAGAQPQTALVTALNDERRSEALYEAVLDKQGDVLPFSHIAWSEQRHQQALLTLFSRYGVSVPPNPWAARQLAVPSTFTAACQVGVASEKANVAMYDRLLKSVPQPDVRAVFTQLRDLSQYHHLVAFQRWAQATPNASGPAARAGTGPGMGMGRGMGGGRGMGSGQCPLCGQGMCGANAGVCPWYGQGANAGAGGGRGRGWRGGRG